MTGIFWLASYPKSGNTWMRLALRSLASDGAAIAFDTDADRTSGSHEQASASARERFDDTLDIDSSDLRLDEIERLRPMAVASWAEQEGPTRVVKTHDAWTCNDTGRPLFPVESTKGVVYIVRDPRDVAISFADHRGLSIDQSIAMMADDDACLAGIDFRLGRHIPQRLRSWSGHVQSWLQAPVERIVVRYEDMITDMASEMRRVATFIGLATHDEAIERAVVATRFAALRAEEERVGFEERSVNSRFFFRRGTAGGWRQTLTTTQIAEIETVHAECMTLFNYSAQ